MDGDQIVIEGRAWVQQVTEHWPPGVREDGPTDYSVTFYDREDPEQWVSHCRIPADRAELGPDGLREIFRRASSRSWRDRSGTYWRVCTCPNRSELGGNGDVGTVSDCISFRRRDARDADVIATQVPGLRPLGHLTDEELQEILAAA